MIFDIILFVLGAFITGIYTVLVQFPIVSNFNITPALDYFLTYLSPFSGVINLTDIFIALRFYLVFLVSWYSFKLFMWIYRHIPFI